jgi:hypothetical protein
MNVMEIAYFQTIEEFSTRSSICHRFVGRVPVALEQTLISLRTATSGCNTSTVIPASRKRRQKGNPVVSDETVMYANESSATLTTDRLHYKLQTRPLVREGAPRRRAKQLPAKGRKKQNLVTGPKGVPFSKTYRLNDRQS